MKSYTPTIIKNLFLIVLFTYPLTGQSQIKSSDIEYIRIAEIEYSNDSLFLWQEIRPMLNRMDTTGGVYRKLALSNEEKNRFLELIDKINLLDIKSNKKQTMGYLPFEITYKINGKSYLISAYQPEMSVPESESFKKYFTKVGDIIAMKKVKEKILLSMADGQYQLKSPKRYQIRIGPSGWESWEKKNGELKRIGMPLVFVDGVERNPNLIEEINPKEIQSFKILKKNEADSLYGVRAKNGVIVIATK
ncbi:MAG: hypothetical protein ACTHYC_00325 [Sphingobacterium sp.]